MTAIPRGLPWRRWLYLWLLDPHVKGNHHKSIDRWIGLLILANHPSLIDVVFLISFVRHADCIVKAALAHNPFMRGPIRAAGFITNGDGAGLLEDCVKSLRGGNNLIVFPSIKYYT